MLTDDYTIRLEAFEGPLDLLLYLIRRAEVEVTDIPIASIADQFNAHIERIDRVDIDAAGDFLVMAATLMEIKSRMIAPRRDDESDAGDGSEAPEGGESDDPRAELIRQLLAYKRYRDAGEALDARRREWAGRTAAARIGFDRESVEELQPPSDLDLEDLGLFDIIEAYARIAAQVNFDALGDHKVLIDDDDTPTELHAEDILDRLRRVAPDDRGDRSLRFQSVFEGRTRAEAIGLFIATLELAKRRAVRVIQDDLSSEIRIQLNEDADSSDELVPGEPDGAA